MKKIFNVVGARPNFMKIALLMEELQKYPEFQSVLVHTGQHYDDKMSKIFFEDLDIPKPHVDLEIGSGSHAEQTAGIMAAFEKLCLTEKPDLVLVVGDVNSTLACSVVASKLCIPIAHVEAGLRSRDRTMPEEINRIVTDAFSDLLFTTSKDADENLIAEGIPSDKIFFVSNAMIDTLLEHKERAAKSDIAQKLGLSNDGTTSHYALLTLHRPSNVDEPETLTAIIDAIDEIQERIPIVFPVHPRTDKQLQLFGLDRRVQQMRNLILLKPQGYLDFLSLLSTAQMVLSDSGGLQEESTVLGVPCLTLRENTERPVTVWEGTNTIVGSDKDRIIKTAFGILEKGGKTGRLPEYWDGKAVERIVKILHHLFFHSVPDSIV